MAAQKDYVRLRPISTPVLSAVAIDSAKTFSVNMDGYDTLLLYINLTRAASTAVLVTYTSEFIPNTGSAVTGFKHTAVSSVGSTGTVVVAPATVSITGSVSDKFLVPIPCMGGNVTFSIIGTAANGSDLVTVYATKAVAA